MVAALFAQRSAAALFVNSYRRYHDSFDNSTPADAYNGRHHEVLSESDKIKQLTLRRRKKEHRVANAA
jgi:hypothetical protein